MSLPPQCAQVEAGSSVAVWGCGAVGLAAIMGSVKAGATRIIAIDINPDKWPAGVCPQQRGGVGVSTTEGWSGCVYDRGTEWVCLWQRGGVGVSTAEGQSGHVYDRGTEWVCLRQRGGVGVSTTGGRSGCVYAEWVCSRQRGRVGVSTIVGGSGCVYRRGAKWVYLSGQGGEVWLSKHFCNHIPIPPPTH